MRAGRTVVAIAFCAASLPGCPSVPKEVAEPPPAADVSGADSPPPAPAAPAATGKSSPVPVPIEGTYEHPGSGIRFPRSVAKCGRSSVQRFDASGDDVGVHYRRFWMDRNALFRLEVTVFVFPPPATPGGRALTPEEHFAVELAQVVRLMKAPREVRRNERFAEWRGVPVDVRSAEFDGAGSPDLPFTGVREVIVVFRAPPWCVTCQATLPRLERDRTLAAFDTLLAELGLPTSGLPPVDARDESR